MKSLIVSLSLALFSPQIFAKSIEIGATKPTFAEANVAEMKGTDGKTYRLDQMPAKEGTLVIFTCNHCPYAVAWEERIAALGNEYTENGKLNVIAINPNDPSANPIDNMDGMKERAKTLGMKFPYVVDSTSKIAVAFGAEKTPEIFLFNKEGKLVYKGAFDDNYNAENAKKPWLKNAIENMLAGKAINPAETASVGCSIKWRDGAKS